MAQAVKKQADKATAILAMQEATLPKSTSKTSNPFDGCEPNLYPTMLGTSQIKVITGNCVKLTSGHILLFG